MRNKTIFYAMRTVLFAFTVFVIATIYCTGVLYGADLPNDAIIVSGTIPATMETGKSYTVSVTVKNTGTATWTKAGNYKLGATVSPSAGLSVPSRALLAEGDSIEPNQQKTFTFTITASSAGSYTINLRMLKEGVAQFGQTLMKTITVTAPANDAQIVSDNIPTTMTAGQSYTVSVTVKNTGTATWTKADSYKLGATGSSNLFAAIRQLLADGDSIATNQQKTFTFTMTAPATTGSYTVGWRMLKEGVAQFGQALTKTVTVSGTALANDAQIVSDNIPTTMKAGQSYTVSVTVKNTGTATWTKADSYKLGRTVSPSAGLTVPTRALLAEGDSIEPNQQKTFTFTITASTTGSYAINLRMLKEGVAQFGQTLTKTITVTAPANDAQIVSDNIPTTMTAGQSYTVSVTVKNTGTATWTAASNYKLGAVGYTDPFTTAIHLNLGGTESIVAGQTKTFSLTMTAPNVAGTYTTDWRMLQSGVAWFGATLSKTVTVEEKRYDAEIVGDTLPETMVAKEKYPVRITVKNIGTATWNPNEVYLAAPAGDPLYQENGSYPLSQSVAPGEEATFNMVVTAPRTVGLHTTFWQMHAENSSFGQQDMKTITVTAAYTRMGWKVALKKDGTVWHWGAGFIPTRVQDLDDVVSINSELSLKKDGTVWSWFRRYIENGNPVEKPPVQIQNIDNIVSVAKLQFYEWSSYLALKKDGTVWAWGDNQFGQLGDGTLETRTSPVQVMDLNGIVMIAANYYHCLALRNDGTVWAWGRGFEYERSVQTRPVQIPTLNGIIAVECGSTYNLALKNDGTVWAWGRNLNGQLGNSTFMGEIEPTPIQVSGLREIVSVSAGVDHNLALRKDGAVFAWGDNIYYQCGTRDHDILWEPVQIPSFTDVTAIFAGGGVSLALKKDGSILAWGCNTDGELGNGIGVASSKPAQIPGLTNISCVRAGGDSSFALTRDGSLWSLGRNRSGLLGDGSYISRNLPVLVGGSYFQTFDTDGNTAYATDILDGVIYTWGANQTYSSFSRPVPILRFYEFTSVQACQQSDSAYRGWGTEFLAYKADGTVWTLTNGQAVEIPEYKGIKQVLGKEMWYGFSLGLKSDGTVWEWGVECTGQPVKDSWMFKIPNLSGIVSIATTELTRYAVKDDGTVWSWGQEGTPTQVAILYDVVDLKLGLEHRIVLKRDGTVWAWGTNKYGQLGNDSIPYSNVPVQVQGLSNVVAISAGDNHNLALLSDGTVWAWGSNKYGQLGNIDCSPFYDVPVTVVDLNLN